jgi:hypothetical protein
MFRVTTETAPPDGMRVGAISKYSVESRPSGHDLLSSWAEFTPSSTLPWATDFIEHALRLLQVP